MAVQFPQTTVQGELAEPFAGAIVNPDDAHLASKVSAEASAEIPFGVAVLRDATNKDHGVVLPHTDAATSAPLLAGVVAHSHAYAKGSELGDSGLKPKVTIQVLEDGQVWVLPEEAVAPGDDVRFRAVAPGAEQVGAWLKTASAGETVDCSAFARWVSSGDATTPCKLDIDVVAASQAIAD